jgi:hypothetical protein
VRGLAAAGIYADNRFVTSVPRLTAAEGVADPTDFAAHRIECLFPAAFSG